jgi:iron complex transport system ATP-binding protein
MNALYPSVPSIPLLSARGLSVGYGSVKNSCDLFPPFDLDFGAGELVCLLGRNGAGKTTLLKTLAGILPPLGGDVLLDGDSVNGLSGRERAQRAALLLTDPGLPPYLLGRELVALGRTPHAPWFSGARADDAAVVDAVLETVRCTHLAHRRLGQLSDGERQRLCLARALAQDAPILLLDEPLAHLDPPAKAEMLGLLHDWTRAGEAQGIRRLVLAAVHEVDLALGFADRCVLLATGKPPFFGTPEESVGEPLHQVFPGWPDFWDPLALRKRRIPNS